MDGILVATGTTPAVIGQGASAAGAGWAARYGARHRMRRLTQFPPGVEPPRRVRIYWRNDHWVLQWWESKLGKNCAERVDGDLIAALVRAREIDRNLLERKNSGRADRVRVVVDV